MDDHPTTEDFMRLLSSCLQPDDAERNALIVRHLLTGCAACCSTLQGVKGVRPLLARLLEMPLGVGMEATDKAPSLNYDWAFARAERRFAALLTGIHPSERLPALLSELASLPVGEQRRRIKAGGRFADPSFIHCLIDRSHAARYQSPRRTLHFADLALLAASACTPEAAGSQKLLSDLRSEAWRTFANAQRICGHLQEAEESFGVALKFQEAGTGSARLRALLLYHLASLRTFQRRFQESIELSKEAEGIFCCLGDNHLLAGVMVNQATTLIYSGEAEVAAEILTQAIPQIDRREDPHLFLAAYHNLARCYIDLDRPDEALALHFDAREIYRECQDPLILLRATWQEGQLLREVGHLHNAEMALLRAQRGFMELGLAYETAMISLDLAKVYSSLGLSTKLRRTIEEALPTFRSLRVDQEVLASLLYLQQANPEPDPTENDELD